MASFTSQPLSLNPLTIQLQETAGAVDPALHPAPVSDGSIARNSCTGGAEKKNADSPTTAEKKSQAATVTGPPVFEPTFWTEDPNVLFRSAAIFPTRDMSFDDQLNAVSRFILILAAIGYFFHPRTHLLAIAAVLLFSVYVFRIYYSDTAFSRPSGLGTEPFASRVSPGAATCAAYATDASGVRIASAVAAAQSSNVLDLSGARGAFQLPSVTNPLGNVLQTDYVDQPQRLPALPAASPAQQQLINQTVQETVSQLNPNHTTIKELLFKNLGDTMQFEQSMRQFHPTASTEIPNDQGAFADFCYGSMVSCKQGNKFACARNLPRYDISDL